MPVMTVSGDTAPCTATSRWRLKPCGRPITKVAEIGAITVTAILSIPVVHSVNFSHLIFGYTVAEGTAWTISPAVAKVSIINTDWRMKPGKYLVENGVGVQLQIDFSVWSQCLSRGNIRSKVGALLRVVSGWWRRRWMKKDDDEVKTKAENSEFFSIVSVTQVLWMMLTRSSCWRRKPLCTAENLVKLQEADVSIVCMAPRELGSIWQKNAGFRERQWDPLFTKLKCRQKVCCVRIYEKLWLL